ncbi:hypothetical protein KM043_008361 [Ampulex compressa]|nr:hypothetical protein KM043_008361 [Ampulex compressa]
MEAIDGIEPQDSGPRGAEVRQCRAGRSLTRGWRKWQRGAEEGRGEENAYARGPATCAHCCSHVSAYITQKRTLTGERRFAGCSLDKTFSPKNAGP